MTRRRTRNVTVGRMVSNDTAPSLHSPALYDVRRRFRLSDVLAATTYARYGIKINIKLWSEVVETDVSTRCYDLELSSRKQDQACISIEQVSRKLWHVKI